MIIFGYTLPLQIYALLLLLSQVIIRFEDI